MKTKKKKRVCTIPAECRGIRPTLSGNPADPTVYHGMKIPLSMKRYINNIGPARLKEIIRAAMNEAGNNYSV